MSIQINPALIAGSITLAPQLTKIGLSLCKLPPLSEGLACVPIQVPNTGVAKYIDLSIGAPTVPISQLCSMYVDNQNCSVDVEIIFDSGYSVPVKSGDTKLFPVLANSNLPSFWVAVPSKSSTAGDFTNIFCINQFIPEFSSEEFQGSIGYGIGKLVQGPLTPSENVVREAAKCNNINALTQFPFDLIASGSQTGPVLIGGIQCYVDTTASADDLRYLTVYTNGNPLNILFRWPFFANTTRQLFKVAELSGINNLLGTVNNTTGIDQVTIGLDATTNLTACQVYVNMQYNVDQ